MIKVPFFFFLFPLLLFSINLKQKDTFVFKIDLKHNYKSGNTLQGLTSIDNKWLISQTNNNQEVILTLLDDNGSIQHKQILNYPSHGQDLSTYRRDGMIYLVTSSSQNNGISILKKSKKSYKFFLDKEIILNNGFHTPTVSQNGKYIVVKNYNKISIYRLDDLLYCSKPLSIFSFFLDQIQQKKSQWLQGIEMKDGMIYVLTGNKKIADSKFLFIYDSYGSIIQKFKLYTGYGYAKKEGEKWELEGLTFYKNGLYTTVMSGSDGSNIKRLFKILKLK